LKAAVVGAGKMGLVHASVLSTLPGVDLVGVCDNSQLVRRFFSSLLGKDKFFEDLNTLLDVDLDILFVTTPIPSHFSILEDVYSRKTKINVFVEKTLSSDYNNSIKLCELARNAKGRNMVGFMKRFAVTFLKAKELLANNSIGKVVSFDAHAFSSDFFGVSTSNIASSRGGVLSDLGSHVIDLALFLLGDFECACRNDIVNTKNNGVFFKVNQSEGLEGSFDISWSKEGYHIPEFGLSIKGLNGNIIVDDDRVVLESSAVGLRQWYKHDLNDNVGFLLGAPEYYREDKAFVQSINTSSNIMPDFFEAAKTDKIISSIRMVN
jgi:predicted dehydrogenase